MEKNLKIKALPEDEIMSNEHNNYKEGNSLKIPVSASIIILTLIILYFSLFNESDYDTGLKYLKQNQYTEAIVEFQKLNTDDNNFRLAQSKINYINGITAYKNGFYKQSILFLAKVESSDEYYLESQILMEKIDPANKHSNLESLSEQLNRVNDTVIIKEKIIELPKEKVTEAEKSNSDLNTNRRYISVIQNLSGKFEILYQSAKNSGMESKKIFLTEMDSLYTEFKKYENNPEQDSKMQELNHITDSWMGKRLSYIKGLITENTVNESNKSVTLMEQGDKDYKLLLDIIINN